MIQRDNEAACVGLKQLGAAAKASAVVQPDLDLPLYPNLVVARGKDGLTLNLQDVGSAKTHLDIHTTIKGNPTPEVTKAVLSSICTLIVSSMGTASWADCRSALDLMAPGSIAQKDMASAYH